GVAVGPVREPGWALREIADTASVAGVRGVALAAGRRLVWPGLTVDVIGPLHRASFVAGDDGTAVNDGSLVLRARTLAGSVRPAGLELVARGSRQPAPR